LGHQKISCRLDRFLISEALLLEGPLVDSNILPKAGLDHWSVQLWVDTIATPKLKPFIFEKLWLSHPDFHEMAHHWWSTAEIQKGTKMYCFQQNLKHCEKMEQRSLREHLLGKKTAKTKTRSSVDTKHPNRAHFNSATGGVAHQKAIGREIQTGRNSMETEISCLVAQRGREKQKIPPPLHDPQMLHQPHHEAGRFTGHHPALPSGNNARAIQLLQGSPLRTPCGSHLCN
jgi:hypothetical protein